MARKLPRKAPAIEVVPLRGEGGDGAVAVAELLYEHVILGREEPDWTVIAFDLRGHGPVWPSSQAIEAQHDGHVGR